MARVFITGGAGLIGSHTARRLACDGHDVAVYDSFQQYIIPDTAAPTENLQYRLSTLLVDVQVVRGSTDDKDHLRRALEDFRPDHVIHLSGLPVAGLAIKAPEEALRSIVEGTVNVLDAVREMLTLRKLVYVSSSLAYGPFLTTPQPESAPKDPVDLYGALKLSAEMLVRTYGSLYDLPYVIVRPSAVYGPSDNNRRVVQVFVEHAIQGLPIIVRDPVTTVLDFTYVTDIARGLCLAALAPHVLAEDFNITFGRGRSLAELSAIVRSHVPDIAVEVGDDAVGFVRPPRGTLDISKARRLLGYEPEVSLEEGVAKYIEYVRSTNCSLTPRSMNVR